MTHSKALVILTLFLAFQLSAAQNQAGQRTEVHGRIIAFHKMWRFPDTKPVVGSMSLPTDLWIVRLNSEGPDTRIVLAKYEIYRTPLSDADLKKELRLKGSMLPAGDKKSPCLQMVTAVQARASNPTDPLSDFVRIEPGSHKDLPALQQMPCLVVESPPTVIEAGDLRNKSR